MRNVASPGIGRDHDERHAKTIDVARSPTGAVIDDLRRRNMVVPATPIVPSDDDGSIRPIGTATDGIYDGSDPGRPTCREASGMVRVLTGRDDPAHSWKLVVGNVGEDLFRRHDHIAPGAASAHQLAIL